MTTENLGDERTLTKETKKTIEDIINQKKIIERNQAEIKDSIESLAEKLGVKKAVLSRRINLIIKEQEKGGEVKSQSTDLDFVEKYFNIE